MKNIVTIWPEHQWKPQHFPCSLLEESKLCCTRSQDCKTNHSFMLVLCLFLLQQYFQCLFSPCNTKVNDTQNISKHITYFQKSKLSEKQ